MKKIKLTKGQFALVDDADFEVLNQRKWYAHKSGHSRTFYAIRNTYEKGTGKRGVIRMHNILMGRIEGLVCDHLNRNGLDNRRENLRLVTPSESSNNKNYPKKLNAAKGVTAISTGGFIARKTIAGKRTYLGYFDTILEAEDAIRKTDS